MPTTNRQSLLWAAAGTLCFFAAGSDFYFSTHFFGGLGEAEGRKVFVDIAGGLCAGIFMLGMAWLKAGGRVFHNFEQARHGRALAYSCASNHKPTRSLLSLD